jgi:hypothetical protein
MSARVGAVLILAIRLYRTLLSGWLGGQCRFYPTCSHYAEDAIREHGAVRGVGLAAWRIARCNPYGRGGIDPVSAAITVRPSKGTPPCDSVLRAPQKVCT